MTTGDKIYSSESTSADIKSAERALTQRPRTTIRMVVALGFILNFILIFLITVAVVLFISKLGAKKLFLEKAGNYVFEIQEARRFEKNYLLYGIGLPDAISFTDNAQQVLTSSRTEFINVIGKKAFVNMSNILDRYQGLLKHLNQSTGKEGTAREEQCGSTPEQDGHPRHVHQPPAPQ